jgi:SAM-dependent methyltransferase
MGHDSSREHHWTYTLFVKHPELYIPLLESWKEKASAEVEGLSKIFAQFGVPERAKLLDLACGIGRHSIPLAKKGYQVVGYDLSPACISKAKEWARQEKLSDEMIRFYRGDLRDVAQVLSTKREKGFNAIINMFTSHGYFGKQEDIRMFKGLLRLAATKSLLIIQTVNRDGLVRKYEPYKIDSITDKIEQHAVRRLNLETSWMENDWKFYERMPDGNLKLLLALPMNHRIYTLHELKKAIEKAGWKYRANYTSIETLAPLSMDSFSMVLVSQK